MRVSLVGSDVLAGPIDVAYVGMGMPLPLVTLVPCYAPPTLTLANPYRLTT